MTEKLMRKTDLLLLRNCLMRIDDHQAVAAQAAFLNHSENLNYSLREIATMTQEARIVLARLTEDERP